MKSLSDLKKVRLELTEIEKFYNIKEYPVLAELIRELIKNNVITPIKSSKTNGRFPSLYKRYSLVKVEKDNTVYIDEIKNELFIDFDITYYMSHIDTYIADREYVIALSNYFKSSRQNLSVPASINERSFEIWGREKFLKDGRGKTILKNLSLDIKDLNVYSTPEPFVCFSFSKKEKQRVLIIENKDTWYSIRKLMIEGNNDILGVPVDTIIYGAGKGIFNSLLEYDLIVEEYLKKPKEVLYWGDIDYEGINIYEGLKEKFKDIFIISIFNNAYKKMINKSIGKNLPPSKEGQNKNILAIFLNELEIDDKNIVIQILKKGLYIPQEIITYKDLKYGGD